MLSYTEVVLDTTPKRRRYIPIRPLLIADAAFELVCAIVLALAAERVAGWLDVAPAVTYVAAAVFAVATLGVGFIARARRPEPRLTRGLAIANVAGGLLGWALMTVFWGSFEPAGRALLGSASDVFLALGVLELLALRRNHHEPL